MDIAQLVNQAIATLRGAGLSYAELILPNAYQVFAALGAIVVAWHGIKAALNDESLADTIGELVDLVMLLSFVWLMLGQYQMFFLEWFLGGFDFVVGRFSGLTGASVFAGHSQLIEAGRAVLESFAIPKSVAWWESPGWVISHAPAYLVKLVTLGVISLAALIYVVMYALGEVLIGVAIGVGPIFIPWLIFDKLAFLFWSWLRFFIVAALYKIVAVLMVGLAAPAITLITDLVRREYAADGILASARADFAASMVVAALSVLIMVMMYHIPHIT